MHKILVIRLYFPLDALRVSDYISPSSGATFVPYVWLLYGYNHTTARSIDKGDIDFPNNLKIRLLYQRINVMRKYK